MRRREEVADDVAKDIARELRCAKNCRIEIRISTRVIKALKRPRRATTTALALTRAHANG